MRLFPPRFREWVRDIDYRTPERRSSKLFSELSDELFDELFLQTPDSPTDHTYPIPIHTHTTNESAPARTTLFGRKVVAAQGKPREFVLVHSVAVLLTGFAYASALRNLPGRRRVVLDLNRAG